MSNSTSLLEQIETAQAQKEVTANALFDAASPAMLGGRHAEACAALTWGYYGGSLVVDGVLTAVANGTFTLAPSTTNYVERTRAGVVSTNSTGFTAGRVPLYAVITGSATVVSYTDYREAAVSHGVAGRLILSVAGSADVTLTAAQARNHALKFTGALTGSIDIYVPDGPQEWTVTNGTTGGYTLTLKTRSGSPAGAGIAVTQGATIKVLADGDDMVGLAAGAGGLTNFTDALGTATPNATVTVASLTATGAATVMDAALQPKGGGALLAAVPDNATTGGNKRGTYAVDWQSAARSNADKVASGTYAVIGGGQHNKASNSHAAIGGGITNTASGIESGVFCGSTNSASANNAAVFSGRNNTANAQDAFIGGGYNHSITGQYGAIVGGRENSVAHIAATAMGWGGKSLNDGTVSYSGGYFAAVGDSQAVACALRAGTANATQKALTNDDSAQATGNQLTLENSSSAIVKGLVVARQNTTGDTKSWEFTAHIRRGANAAATAMVATCTPTVIANDAGAATWALDVSADTTRGALQVRVTGEAAKTIRTVCHLQAAYVQG